MTNTDTADADATALQVARLAQCRLGAVRITVKYRGRGGRRTGEIVRKVRGLGRRRPDRRRLPLQRPQAASDYPEAARALAKVPHQPATSGRAVHTTTLSASSRVAIENGKRSGSASTGARSTTPVLAETDGREGRRAEPRTPGRHDQAMVESAIRSGGAGEATGLAPTESSFPKVSGVRDLIDVYRRRRPLRYPLTWV